MRSKCFAPTTRIALAVLLAGAALLLVLGGVSLAAPDSLPTSIAYDPAVAALVSQVTTQTLADEVAGLSGERPVTITGVPYTITTRYSYSTESISMATRYAYEQFAAAGLTVTFHEYVFDGQHWRNVAAEKPGLVDPAEIYLLTAHLDDMPTAPPAPGADDNASGAAAVLVAARALAAQNLDYTLRFVLFTGEEQGLRGSRAYAADCAARGENILGVVNLDMLAYNTDAPIIDLHAAIGVPASLELTRLFSDVVGVYALNLIPDRQTDGWQIKASDQLAFLEQGYPAFLAIEDWDDHTPQYHQPGDRLSTFNLEYYADLTRAAVATLAHLGRLAGGVVSGTVYAADSGHPLAGAALTATGLCTLSAVTDVAGRYALDAPAGVYTLTVSGYPGYYAATISGVAVLSAAVTPQDVALTPWPRWYVPLVIRHGP